MTIPYNLPPSCTNGGFQLKTHYYKYLAYLPLTITVNLNSAFEIEKQWGKTAPPPEHLEFLSAKGGGIMTRPSNWRQPDPKPDSPSSTPAPGAAVRRTTRSQRD
jgi:chromatin structure-remodeling complex subunit RSC9